MIFEDAVEWMNNFLLSVIVYAFYLFWDWAGIPYDWNKKDK